MGDYIKRVYQQKYQPEIDLIFNSLRRSCGTISYSDIVNALPVSPHQRRADYYIQRLNRVMRTLVHEERVYRLTNRVYSLYPVPRC